MEPSNLENDRPLPNSLLDLIEPQKNDAEMATARALRRIVRLLRVIRTKWTYIAVSLSVCVLLGIFYYSTATRLYFAKAELLIQETGPVFSPNQTTSHIDDDSMLPTYERLFQSGVVLEGAATRLSKLSPKLLVDFHGVAREKWSQVIKEQMSAQTIRRTRAIQVGYKSKSPHAAVAVVQCIVNSYLDFIKKYYRDESLEIENVLKNERVRVAERLSVKERELVTAHQKLGDIGIRDGERMIHPVVQRTIQINESLITAQKQRVKLQSLLSTIQNAIRHGEDVRQHLLEMEPTVGREIVLAALGLGQRDNNLITHFEQQLLKDRNELAALNEHLGKRHPKVLHLSNAIRKSEVYLASYHEEAGQRARRLNESQLGDLLLDLVNQKLKQATAHETNLQKEYELNRASAVKLHGELEATSILEAEVTRLRDLNKTLLSRIENLDINQNRAGVRVEAVDHPKASAEPFSPSRLIVLLISCGTGLVLGVTLILGQDLLDDRFRSPDELKHELDTSVLAMVRQLPERSAVGLEAIQISEDPDGIASEAFRTLRTNLAFQMANQSCLAFSSPEPGDGKTTTLSNLAVAFAQIGKRTLMIDADLRKPGLSKLFGVRGQTGLTEILNDRQHLSESVKRHITSSGLDNLDLLPCGERPHDPTGLLSSARFHQLIDWAQEHYDQVLIDGTPILVASDAVITGKAADGLVLVVQPEKNHRRSVLRAADEIRAANINLMGIVINRITSDSEQGYGGYGYGYGYGYREAYGDVDESETRPIAA